MDNALGFINNLFMFGLAVTAAALLWSLVHPEHFAWLRREPRPATTPPVVLPRAVRVTGWVLFYAFMVGAAVFGLHTLLTRN